MKAKEKSVNSGIVKGIRVVRGYNLQRERALSISILRREFQKEEED